MTNPKTSTKRPPSLVVFWLVFISFISLIPLKLVAANPLQNHPSAYIALHADDPIHWHLWSAETLAKAQQQNKPLFISSGYFACHWCHVMHQENYKNHLVADLLNRHFISVKVDRELTPDLDDYLLNQLRQATGQAGWPLHVILTPEGHSFSGFVYQPTDTLLQTLSLINHWWQTDADKLRALAQPATQTQAQTLAQTSSPIRRLNRTELEQAIQLSLPDLIDNFDGGLQAIQKFPHSPLLKYLLLNAKTDQDTQDWLILTLTQMQTEQLYDHIHHGFFRYTVDPNWQEPHFEKMLYDNAQLAELFFIAGQRFGRDDFIHTAHQTLQYIERELLSPVTGLAKASQSAIDQQGIDGGRYIWSRTQLQAQFNPSDFAILNQAWLLDNPAPFDLGWLPKPINSPHWTRIQATLAQRPSLTDDKKLISWNGLLLSAYARGYQVSQRPDYALRASGLAERLIRLLQQPNPARALNEQGQLFGQATLEDFGYSLAGLQLWQTVAGLDYQPWINPLSDKATRYFYVENGWLASQESLLPGQQTPGSLPDLATPSASAILSCDQDVTIAIQAGSQPWQYASYLTYQGCQ